MARETDSEDEGEGEGERSPEPGGDGHFARDALLAGFSIDDLKRAEALATNDSPTFGSADVGA